MKPRLGVTYEEAKTRCKRIWKNGGHPEARMALINSIRNQCRLAEGEKALTELDKEISADKTSSLSLSGAGNKQTGIGKGKRLGSGRWRYQDGKWVQVS